MIKPALYNQIIAHTLWDTESRNCEIRKDDKCSTAAGD